MRKYLSFTIPAIYKVQNKFFSKYFNKPNIINNDLDSLLLSCQNLSGTDLSDNDKRSTKKTTGPTTTQVVNPKA
jgi:hypothetical protein